MCVNPLGLGGPGLSPSLVVILALPHPDPILPQMREVPLLGSEVYEQDVTHGETAPRPGLVPESMSYLRHAEEVLPPIHCSVDTSSVLSIAPPHPGVGLGGQETSLLLL